jgi:hypothetical protein
MQITKMVYKVFRHQIITYIMSLIVFSFIRIKRKRDILDNTVIIDVAKNNMSNAKYKTEAQNESKKAQKRTPRSVTSKF